VSLARIQHDQGIPEDPELQADLEGISRVMQDVLTFLQQERGANPRARMLRKERTIARVKELDRGLDETFRVFMMRSNVSLRQSQRTMEKQLEQITGALVGEVFMYAEHGSNHSSPGQSTFPHGWNVNLGAWTPCGSRRGVPAR